MPREAVEFPARPEYILSMRLLRITAWILIAVVASAAGALWLERLQGEAPDQTAALAGSYDLVDHEGEKLPGAWFRDGPAVVFFGFTHCPDVCPTTLATVSRWLEALEPEAAAALKVAFVTIDPGRDTPAALKSYLGHFDSQIVGITGSEAALRQLASDLGASFAVETGGDRYEVTHSAAIYLIDARGRFAGSLKEDTLPEIARQRLAGLAEGATS